MRHIFKAEIEYFSVRFSAFLVVIPLLVFLELNYGDFPKIYIGFLLYFTVLSWFLLVNKERRIIQITTVPISRLKAAATRILIVSVFTLIIYSIYISIYLLMNMMPALNIGPMLISACFVMLIFFISFIVRDLAFDFFRRIGLNKTNVKLVLMVLILLLNIITVYAFMYTKSTGSAPAYFEALIQAVENHNPLQHPSTVFYFIIISISTAILSILSYERRKSYLE